MPLKQKVESNPWHESQASHERMESAISVEGMREGTTAGVTIGEALEAVAESIGDKPVDLSDAAAIQIAEMIATGSKTSLGAGLGAEAQAAATANAQLMYDEDKTKISEILQVLCLIHIYFMLYYLCLVTLVDYQLLRIYSC